MCWLDPTTLCVIFLILTLSGLWAYVTIARKSTRVPNFTSVLNEVSQKFNNGQASNKKPPKSKGRKKQVDGKLISSATADDGIGIKTQPLPTLEVRSTSSDSGDTKQVPEEKKVENKADQEKKSKAASNVQKEEGEWQTQLSRPQLRALRKQRTDKRKGPQEPNKGGTDSEGNSNGGGDEKIDSVSVSSDGIRTKLVGVKVESSSNNASLEVTSDGVKEERPECQDSTGVTSDPDLELNRLSPELFEASLPIIDVETALVEAACSSVSSVEEEKSSAHPDTATKKTQKKRKSRRKNKQAVVNFDKPVEIDRLTEVDKLAEINEPAEIDKLVEIDEQVEKVEIHEQVETDKPIEIDKQVEIVAADSMEMEAIPDSSENQEEWVVIN